MVKIVNFDPFLFVIDKLGPKRHDQLHLSSCPSATPVCVPEADTGGAVGGMWPRPHRPVQRPQ